MQALLKLQQPGILGRLHLRHLILSRWIVVILHAIRSFKLKLGAVGCIIQLSALGIVQLCRSMGPIKLQLCALGTIFKQLLRLLGLLKQLLWMGTIFEQLLQLRALFKQLLRMGTFFQLISSSMGSIFVQLSSIRIFVLRTVGFVVQLSTMGK